MNIFKKNSIYIVILLINIMFSFSIVAHCYTIKNFNYVLLFGISLVCVLLYFVFNYIFEKPMNKILFLSIFITIILICIFYSGVAINLYNQCVSNSNILRDEVNNRLVTNFAQFKIFFILAIPILIFFFLIMANKGFTSPIIIYMLAILIIFWSLGFHKAIKENLFRAIFLLIITFGVNYSFKSIKRMEKLDAKIHLHSQSIFVFALIPAFLICEITTILPQNFKGKYNKSISEKFIGNYSSGNNNNMDKMQYGLEESGYTNNSKRLGGPIDINDDLVLRVKAEKPMYLRGSVQDNYNGFVWTRNHDNYNLIDNATDNIVGSSFDFMTNKKSLVVYSEHSKISTIFAPAFSYKVNLDKGNVFYNNALTFKCDLSNNKKYEVDYYSNTQLEEFESCSNIPWLKKDLNPMDIYNYEPYYVDYLQVPNTITQRTKDLLKNITSSCKNHYEQVSKIKTYLDQNYKYTTNVSIVPNNEDFVDYFLFTEKKGYCVYFATAATMLCRMEGIPARYVEGFKMGDDKDQENLYKVTNKEAHAWCEILTDPDTSIWTRLEATPADTTTLVNEEPRNSNASANKPVVNTPSESKTKKDPESNTLSKDTQVKTNKKNIPIIKVIILILILLIILTISKIFFALSKTKCILKESSFIPFYKHCIKRLAVVGIVKPNNLGELEYAKTICDPQLKKMVCELVEAAYQEYYGKNPADDFDRILVYQQIEAYIKVNSSEIQYLTKKYLYF